MDTVNIAEHYDWARAVVVAEAKRNNVPWDKVDDMIQEAMMGLMRAKEKFDPSHNVPFRVYARSWIHAKVWRYLAQYSDLIRVPVRKYYAKQRIPAPLSLDADSGNGLSLYDTVGNDDVPPDVSAEGSIDKEGMWKEVSTLPKRMQIILRRRFINGETLEAIGDDLGICKERVSQIEKEAFKRLKRKLGKFLS